MTQNTQPVSKLHGHICEQKSLLVIMQLLRGVHAVRIVIVEYPCCSIEESDSEL